MKSLLVSVAVVLGLIFLALAALYWLTPAGGLPAFLPGFRAGSTAIHVKHAAGMLVVGFDVARCRLVRQPPRIRLTGSRSGYQTLLNTMGADVARVIA